MPKETWIIASALTIALLIGLLGFASCDKKQRLEEAQAEMAHAQVAAAKSQAEAADLKDKIALKESFFKNRTV